MKYLGDFEKIGSVVTSRRWRPRRRDWLKSKKAERTADAAKNKNIQTQDLVARTIHKRQGRPGTGSAQLGVPFTHLRHDTD